jgi:hypothetical protein
MPETCRFEGVHHLSLAVAQRPGLIASVAKLGNLRTVAASQLLVSS